MQRARTARGTPPSAPSTGPLLEDVNLRGARGILVNVTAGPDLGMEEFAAVGDAIGEFASDDALVVMGTAFDENIQDEMRVTVVATGVGVGQSQHSHTPMAAAQRPTGRRTERAPDGGLRLVDDQAQRRGQPPVPDYGADTATGGYLDMYAPDAHQPGMAHGAPVQPHYPQSHGAPPQNAPAHGYAPHGLSQPSAPAQGSNPPQLTPTLRYPSQEPSQGGAPQGPAALPPAPDYGRYDKPTVTREPSTVRARGNLAQATQEDLEYLDIPAFLRKQADCRRGDPGHTDTNGAFRGKGLFVGRAGVPFRGGRLGGSCPTTDRPAGGPAGPTTGRPAGGPADLGAAALCLRQATPAAVIMTG